MSSKPGSTKVTESEPTDKENRERLRRLGMQCVSPGFGKMDNRMFSTIQLSKDIAKEQKEVIQKLSTRQSDVFKNSESGDEATVKQVVESNQESEPSSVGNFQDSSSKKSSKSLKRSRIPPPLDIDSSATNEDYTKSRNNATSARGTSNRFMGARSAPAHITRYPRGKSKVQYLGRVNDLESHLRKKPKVQPSWQPMANAPFTPYAYYPPPNTAMPYHMGYAPYQNAYQTPYMMAPVPYAMMQQSSYADPPTRSTLQRDFEAYRSQNPGVGTRDLFGNNESRWAPIQAQPQSARDEFFGSRVRQPPARSSAGNKRSEASKSFDSPNRRCDSDNEEVDLAIEDGAEPTNGLTDTPTDRVTCASANKNPLEATMAGELRLQQESFAFSFSLLESATDKKMFMSICDKVWDEYQVLAQREKP
ncbi:LANO_0E09846g1_1 [Lachancea nothofagi CBS 11611]|uniref:LANO_0E09846g1_1 n=1 Tax=Lachancea nothofagi CBS 11611 TaxID=1266666 RepID=A0A1G4JW51_9SACH|nr:LANO_0E09846g1_1 [Lachancea nothofagi CBS 11611]